MRTLVVLVASLVMVGIFTGCAEEQASEESKADKEKEKQERARVAKEEGRVPSGELPTNEEPKKAGEKAMPAKLEPYVLSGTGQAVTQTFNLEPGLRTFEVEYGGAPKLENFSVELLNRDGTGRDSELLFNEVTEAGIGFTGSQAVQVRTRGAYVLQVKADGPWEVTIT